MVKSRTDRAVAYDLGGGRVHIREKGDLLHPIHEPIEVLRYGIDAVFGPVPAGARPPGGKIIKRKMLHTKVERLPMDLIVISWDIALSGGRGPVRLCRAAPGELYYVLEVVRGKFPFDRLKDYKIIAVKERYGRASLVIEEGAISHGLIQAPRENNINVVDYRPKGDKTKSG